MRVLFLYYDPHPVHAEFARAIRSEFKHCYISLKNISKTKLPTILFNKYDICLCEGGAPLFPAVLAKKYINNDMKIINLVADETFIALEHPELSNFSKITNFLHKVESNYIDAGIAVSNFAKKYASKYINGPIKIVHPFINPTLQKELLKTKPKINEFNILFVGRSDFSKGLDLLIESFKNIRKEYPNAKLTIVGRGHNRNKLGKIDGIEVLGWINNLAKVYSNASLFVQPSRMDTFPVTTLEAMAAGLPCIVTKMTGTKELLDKKFISEVNSADLYDKISGYFSLPISQKIKISKKNKKISKQFNRNKQIKKFKIIFNEILNCI